MILRKRALLLFAALNGLLAVGLGAFATHAVKDPAVRDLLHTGSLYGLTHAAAALAVREARPFAAELLTAGALVFSVSLYALAGGAPHGFGAITPAGGLLMLLGWAMLAISAFRGPSAQGSERA